MNPTDIINSQAFLGLPKWAQIVFGFFIAISLMIAFLLQFKEFRKLFKNLFIKIFHLAKQEPLLMHQLFFNKSYYYGLIYRMNFSDKKKTELFIIMMKNKADVAISIAKEFVKEHSKKLDDYTTQQLRDLLYGLINKVTKKAAQLARDKYTDLYGREKGLKLWGLIYESDGGYKGYWEEKTLFLNKNIDRIISSKSRNNQDSVRSMLSQLDIAVDIAISDCEEAFENRNGQISKLINQE